MTLLLGGKVVTLTQVAKELQEHANINLADCVLNDLWIKYDERTWKPEVMFDGCFLLSINGVNVQHLLWQRADLLEDAEERARIEKFGPLEDLELTDEGAVLLMRTGPFGRGRAALLGRIERSLAVRQMTEPGPINPCGMAQCDLCGEYTAHRKPAQVRNVELMLCLLCRPTERQP